MEHQSAPTPKAAEVQRQSNLSLPARSGRGGLDHPLIGLQCVLGNQTVRHLIQAKLEVNQPGDVYEQEADRVANAVLGMPEADPPMTASRMAASPISIQRMCSACANEDHSHSAEEEGEAISGQAKALGGGSCESAPSGAAPEEERPEEEAQAKIPVMTKALSADRPDPGGRQHVESALRQSGGAPLSGQIRSFMEARFGADFGQVRLHTDSIASDAARTLRAEAFAAGRDVYFQAGRYDPTTQSGRRLLAHELTHVLQQSGGGHGSDLSGGAPAGEDLFVQRYTLTGFPTAEEAAMNAAVPTAISTVKSCAKLNFVDRRWLPSAIDSKEYRYVEDLGLCGWTFPASSYIKIGKDAFNHSTCCDLASTVAHEASHTIGYFEGQARNMECNCFGCSCST